MTQPTVGYIGLGIMGRGMAHNLLKAGYTLNVWNRTASRMDELASAGATPRTSPADVAAHSDIIIICVSDTPDVVAVIAGVDGVLQGLRAGALVIDMSTISPQTTVELASQVRAKGASRLEAPVSGGRDGAA